MESMTTCLCACESKPLAVADKRVRDPDLPETTMLRRLVTLIGPQLVTVAIFEPRRVPKRRQLPGSRPRPARNNKGYEDGDWEQPETFDGGVGPRGLRSYISICTFTYMCTSMHMYIYIRCIDIYIYMYVYIYIHMVTW